MLCTQRLIEDSWHSPAPPVNEEVATLPPHELGRHRVNLVQKHVRDVFELFLEDRSANVGAATAVHPNHKP